MLLLYHVLVTKTSYGNICCLFPFTLVGQPIVLTQAEVDRLKAQGLIKCETNSQQQQQSVPQQQQCQPATITSMPSVISPAIPVSTCSTDSAPTSPQEPPPNVDVSVDRFCCLGRHGFSK